MSAPFRLPRAAALTAAMFTLAAGAHVFAGGTLPEPGIAAGLWALTLAPVWVIVFSDMWSARSCCCISWMFPQCRDAMRLVITRL